MKEVEFTIKNGTNEVTIETFGITGQECTKVTEALTVGLGGSVKSDDKKPEYWDNGPDVHINVGK